MRKQITSLLLTLAMLLSLVPTLGVTASAADDTSYTQAEIRDYATFASYLESGDSRDLTLENDIDYTMGYDDDYIKVWNNQKLDLNGHKIRIDATKRAEFFNLITITSGEFTLYDSKGGGGAIEVEFARDYKRHSIIKISPASDGEPVKFTMNGGTLTRLNPLESNVYGDNGCISDDYFNPFKGSERPQITINGGTINCPYDWDRSQYSKNVQKSMLSTVEYMPTALLLRYSNLTVNGGTFNGIVWTENLTWSKEDTEPRVVLNNGGVFNYPFAVTALPKNVTQVVIDGAQFNDGFYVGESKIIYSFHAENDPSLLLKSGVFDSKGKNPKLAIYNATAKYFPNSAITVNERVYTSENIKSLVGTSYDDFYLQLNPKSPIKIIRDAWGVMESVKLDGKSIDYAKDWKGAVREIDNSKAHTITFQWKPLAPELSAAGYRYDAMFQRQLPGDNLLHGDIIRSADQYEYSYTIPKGAVS